MNKSTLKSQHHCVYNIQYHLVLVTKFRHKVINTEILDHLIEMTKVRIESCEGELIETNCEPDHLHILFELPPKFAVSGFVNALKTGTSRKIRNEFSEHLKLFY